MGNNRAYSSCTIEIGGLKCLFTTKTMERLHKSGGGITQSVLDRIAELENRLENVTNTLQGKLDASKVTNSTTTTEQGYATDARQLNPAVDGSLAGKVESLKNDDKNKYFLKGGVYISGGSDLNNYRDVGNYFCSFNVEVAKILNCPTKSAFTMKIELSTGNDYPCQILRDYDNGFIYYRYTSGSSIPYGPWRVIKSELVQT